MSRLRRWKSQGDEPVIGYSARELEKLYLKQGLTRPEARSQARIASRVINRLNRREQGLWKRVRAHEQGFSADQDRTL